MAGGKTLSCLKPLNASQTPVEAGALPALICKQLGFSPSLMKFCFFTYITQAQGLGREGGTHMQAYEFSREKHKMKFIAMFPCLCSKGLIFMEMNISSPAAFPCCRVTVCVAT